DVQTLVSGHQVLTQDVQLKIAPGQTAKVILNGKVANLKAAPLKASLQLQWIDNGIKQSQVIGFMLARAIDAEPTVSRLPIENSADLNFLASAGTLNDEFAG